MSFAGGMLTGIAIGKSQESKQSRGSAVFDAEMTLGVEAFFRCVESNRCAPKDCAPCLEKLVSGFSSGDYAERYGQRYRVYAYHDDTTKSP